MIKRMFLALAIVAIAGCSSVPLDNVPVEDKSASAVTGQPGGPGAGLCLLDSP